MSVTPWETSILDILSAGVLKLVSNDERDCAAPSDSMSRNRHEVDRTHRAIDAGVLTE